MHTLASSASLIGQKPSHLKRARPQGYTETSASFDNLFDVLICIRNTICSSECHVDYESRSIGPDVILERSWRAKDVEDKIPSTPFLQRLIILCGVRLKHGMQRFPELSPPFAIADKQDALVTA